MFVILPSSVSLECKNFGDKSVKFKYNEYFSNIQKKEKAKLKSLNVSIETVVQNTHDLFKNMILKIHPNLKVKRVGKTGLSVSGILHKEDLGDFLTGEFMGWGNFGQARLIDLLVGALAAR